MYPNLKIKMEFNEFVRNRNNCYIAENGFLFWKILYDGNSEYCLLDGGGFNIFVFTFVLEGELVVQSEEKQYVLAKNSFAIFFGKANF